VGDSIAIAKRTGAMVISNDEIANWFAGQGIEKTHGQHLGGGYKHPFGYLKLTFAIHGSALPDGSNGGNPCGFLLEPVCKIRKEENGSNGDHGCKVGGSFFIASGNASELFETIDEPFHNIPFFVILFTK